MRCLQEAKATWSSDDGKMVKLVLAGMLRDAVSMIKVSAWGRHVFRSQHSTGRGLAPATLMKSLLTNELVCTVSVYL